MLDEIITTSITTMEEKDIYLDHCHQDVYYEEVVEDDVDGEDAVALYNQFFVQQAKLSREMEKKQHLSAEKQSISKSSNNSVSSSNSGDGEETAEEDLSTSTTDKDALADLDVAVVFQIQESKDGKEEIKVPLKERLQEEEEDLLRETLSSSTTTKSPKSPSRKKYK